MLEVTIGLEVDQSDQFHVNKLIDDIEKKAGVSRFEKANIDGTVSSALLYIQALSAVVTAIAPFVLELVRNRSVRKIKVGDIEIENPSEEQVRKLLAPQ